MSSTVKEHNQVEPLFNKGQKVLAGPLKLPMIVISSFACIGGQKYQLGFVKKDGTRDERRNYRFFFERDLKPQP